MNSSVFRSAEKSLSPRDFALNLYVLFSTMLIILLFVSPILLPATTTNLINVQDEGMTDRWVKMRPSGAWASFEMPKKPRYVERSFSPVPDEPPIKVRMHLVTVADGNLTYVFSYHDLHAKPLDQKAANGVLQGAVKGSVSNVLGQLVDPAELGLTANPQNIKQGQYAGRQFVCRFIQNETSYIVTGRVYLVDKRLFQLNCIMAEDKFDANMAAKFLRSFEIRVPEDDSPPRPRDAD